MTRHSTDRPTLLAALGVAAGALSGACPDPSSLEVALAAVVALGAFACRARPAEGSSFVPGRATVLASISLALFSHTLQDRLAIRHEAAARQARAAIERSDRCDLEGGVEEAWRVRAGAGRALVRLVRIDCAGRSVDFDGRAPAGGMKLLLALPAGAPGGSTVSAGPDDPVLPRPGDRIEAHARLSVLRPGGNPGGFDSAALLAGRRVLLAGSVKHSSLVQIRSGAAPSTGAALARARVRLEDRLRIALLRGARNDPSTQPLLSALLLGQRSELDPAVERSLQASGLYHLVAISGMHVVLLGWIVLLAARRALPSAPASWLVAALLSLYVLLVGAPSSALRALGMFLLWTLGRQTGRRTSGVAVVGAAAAVLLILRPGLRADAGFWLSLCATAGIVGRQTLVRAGDDARRGGPVRAPVAPESGWRASLIQSLALSAAAYLAVSPLEGLWFQRWTPHGIVLNLIAVPLSTLLLGCALALAALGGAPVSAPIAWCADMGVRALAGLAAPRLWEIELFRLVPPAAGLVAIHCCAAAALLTPRRRSGGVASRPHPDVPAWRMLLAAAHLALILPAAPRSTGAPELTLWDVGQGESILVRLADASALLVDTGGRLRDGDTAARRWVLPALRASGVRRLRALAITHLDSDHASGLEEILSAMRPREIWAGRLLPSPEAARLEELARRHRIPLRLLERGDDPSGTWGRIEVLGPGRNATAPSGDNAGSLVLRVGAGASAMLLTGDLESPGERDLAGRGLPHTALLKVSHHGSRSSSDPGFLRALRPQAALISAGARNAWGHPHTETLQRLRRCGARVLSTSEGGAVRARLLGGILLLERWRAGAWRIAARLPLPAEAGDPSGTDPEAGENRSGRDEHLLQRNRDERQDEDRQRQTQQEFAPTPERLRIQD